MKKLSLAALAIAVAVVLTPLTVLAQSGYEGEKATPSAEDILSVTGASATEIMMDLEEEAYADKVAPYLAEISLNLHKLVTRERAMQEEPLDVDIREVTDLRNILSWFSDPLFNEVLRSFRYYMEALDSTRYHVKQGQPSTEIFYAIEAPRYSGEKDFYNLWLAHMRLMKEYHKEAIEEAQARGHVHVAKLKYADKLTYLTKSLQAYRKIFQIVQKEGAQEQ